MTGHLVVLGSVNADHILQVERFPRPGETISGHGYRIVPGGKGANQAVAAARLGGRVSFIACVGDDAFGHQMIEAFQADGLDTRAVSPIENLPTGVAIIYVAANGENSIGISPEANSCLTTGYLSGHLPLIRSADALLMQLETPLEGIVLAAKTAREASVRVVLNPAPARPLPDELLSQVDLITPNETEAELLTGIAVKDDDSAQRAANILHDKGISQVLITLGPRGVWVSEQGQGRRVAGFTVDARDTTAAGDTFNGGLLTALLAGKTLDDALQFANAAAAISVTRTGAQTSIPSRDEVIQFINDPPA